MTVSKNFLAASNSFWLHYSNVSNSHLAALISVLTPLLKILLKTLDILCKLSFKETICIKCQTLLLRKHEKRHL